MSQIDTPGTAFSLERSDDHAPRQRDERHLAFIRTLPCVVTGVYGVEAAHVSYRAAAVGKRQRGLGEKADDQWTVPLAPVEHRRQHSMNERAYWQSVGIDPIAVAQALYGVSGDEMAATMILTTARMGLL
ncbi:DUF968 domain-containing protein [Mangrovibrevibacter kandeliae]|uniref:DUF968 domain-containing protein n=1 Tax=Mangrovibrevibacter kandeliae TaxID=2968473 RepID=UPI002119AC7A|nr:DUF968 domain-containing protein [Aurantimonas sp. CSK15Z-1]